MEISTESRRNKLQISTDILGFATKPRRPTHIMYHVNLNYSQLKRHLSWLVEMSLLEEIMEPFHAFRITKKGKNFAQMFCSKDSKQVLVQKSTISMEASK